MNKNLIHIIISIFTLSLFFYSCKKETVLFREDFNSNSNHWDTISTPLLYSKIENGKFILSGEMSNVGNLSLIQSELLNKDILLTTSVRIEKFYVQSGLAGIILFADNQKFPENYIFFGITGLQEVVVSRESKDTALSRIFYKQKNKVYTSGQFNEFSVLIHKGIIQFSLNKKPVISLNRPKNTGNFYGFIVLNSQMAIDEILITN